MILWTVLRLLAWLPLQETSLTSRKETLLVEEGQMAILNCVTSQAKNSSLQWISPSGFTIFLNNRRALREKKYQLLHYSSDQLTISISNVTLQDEGVYKCLDYTKPIRTKEVNVIVIATPRPILEASIIETPNGKEVLLKCFAKGSKPPPKITWLLSNGSEMSGETQNTFEPDGKKCNTTSLLRVHEYEEDANANCLVQHEGLRGKLLLVRFWFKDLESKPVSTTTPIPTTTITSEFKPVSTTGPTPTTTIISGPESDSNTVEHNGTLSFQSSQTPTEPVIEECSSVDMNITGYDQTTQKCDFPKPNASSVELIKKKHGIILLTLVSFLILVLLIILQLFIMKLRKAHVTWKKENDISELTLESYRSRSNNDSTSSQEKNSQGFSHKSGMKYIITSYMGRKSKNPKENIQDSALKQDQNHLPETRIV